MEDLARRHTDLLLVRVDIERWGSPVAEQFGLRRLPYLMLYENGRLISNDLSRVLRLLD